MKKVETFKGFSIPTSWENGEGIACGVGNGSKDIGCYDPFITCVNCILYSKNQAAFKLWQESFKKQPTIELREDEGCLDFPNLYINGSHIGYVNLSVTDSNLDYSKKILREAFAMYSPPPDIIPYMVGITTPGDFVEIEGVEHMRLWGLYDDKDKVAMLNMETDVSDYIKTSTPCNPITKEK